MASTINTNVQSLTAQRNLGVSQNSLSTSMQRLSSGLRINSAKDDAAGLAISERMGTQVRGLNQAARNANDGVSMAQTAEGALGTIGNNLQRIRELAVQSRNATNSDGDRSAMNSEVQQLKQEIQRVAEQTNFNGTKLLNGSFQNQAFQVGANQGQTINIAQIANSNINELGSWDSAVTSASATGVKPVGDTTTTPGGTGSLDLSAIAYTTGAGVAAFDLVVNGSTLNITATAEVTDGPGTRAAVAVKVAAAINGAAAGTATASTTSVTLNNAAGANALSVSGPATGVTFTGANLAGITTKTDFSAIGAGEFTLTGTKADGSAGAAVDIVVAKAGSASDRTTALVNAINAKTHETNVTASVVNGALSMQSATGNFTVGGAKATTGAGLTAGVTSNHAVGTAKNGFAALDISTTTGADDAILAMDAALKSVNSSRADLGAIQNRFSSVVDNLNTNSENLSAARSRILDADFAQETANLSRSQILQQAGTAMVAQANQLPQGVLSLLR